MIPKTMEEQLIKIQAQKTREKVEKWLENIEFQNRRMPAGYPIINPRERLNEFEQFWIEEVKEEWEKAQGDETKDEKKPSIQLARKDQAERRARGRWQRGVIHGKDGPVPIVMCSLCEYTAEEVPREGCPVCKAGKEEQKWPGANHAGRR